MQNLNVVEARVIGVLIEKEVTTPDQYPLTLNSLITGCNQKTNREPVMNLDESEVQDALDTLEKTGLVMESRVGSRVSKYKHRFCNTEFSELKLSKQEIGVICVMLLRGAQTPGELRTRTNRLCEFNDVQQVEDVLNSLIDKSHVRCLPREAGKRESRYLELFTDGAEERFATLAASLSTTPEAATTSVPGQSRVDQLETRVTDLENELAEIKSKLADLL